MGLQLRVEGGVLLGKVFDFPQPDTFLVGRSEDAHLRLPEKDAYISRRHCLIEVAPPNCYVMDLRSRNGTFVNGTRLPHARLCRGDEVRLGTTLLRVADLQLDLIVPESPAELASPTHRQDCLCAQCRVAVSGGAISLHEGEVAEFLCDRCCGTPTGGAPKRIGKYEILGELGRGGFGVVHKGRDPSTGRIVAVKTSHATNPFERTMRLRFQREIEILGSLRHANIIRLLDHGEDDGREFFASEYLSSGDLGTFAVSQPGGEIPAGLLHALFAQVLNGVASAHAKGFVHRDIKPSNILLHRKPDGQWTAKVADFGLAKCFTLAGGPFLTRAKEGAGSIYYMAPEQVVQFREAGPPADVYSLGASLYFLVTGAYPYDFPGPVKQLQAAVRGKRSRDPLIVLLEDQPTPVQEKNPRVSPGLASLINRAIRKKPEERFASAREMLDAFGKVFSQER